MYAMEYDRRNEILLKSITHALEGAGYRLDRSHKENCKNGRRRFP